MRTMCLCDFTTSPHPRTYSPTTPERETSRQNPDLNGRTTRDTYTPVGPRSCVGDLSRPVDGDPAVGKEGPLWGSVRDTSSWSGKVPVGVGRPWSRAGVRRVATRGVPVVDTEETSTPYSSVGTRLGEERTFTGFLRSCPRLLVTYPVDP